MPSDPESARASKKKEAKPKEPPKPPKMRRREFLKVAGLGALAAALGISKAEAQEAERVAQATTPTSGTSANVRSSGQAQNRLMDGGGGIITDAVPTPMTPQEFQEQIAYMFDLTGQFEVSPDSSGRYVTGDFVVKRSTGLGDMAPIDSVAIYARSSLDGVTAYPDAIAPLLFIPTSAEQNFRVFRFRIDNNPVIHNEVTAVVTHGAVRFFYFNESAKRYVVSGAAYGSDRFGPNPKIGLEINTQAPVNYIGAAVMDSEKIDAQGNPSAGAEVAAVTFTLAETTAGLTVGAGLYKIEG